MARIDFKFYFGLIRSINLIIVALTMFFFRYLVLEGLDYNLNLLDFTLFVLTTMVVTASGYVINDIYDIGIDKINKTTLLIDSNNKVKKAWRFFYTLIAVGLMLTIYLANKYHHFDYALLYPSTIIVLWYYAKALKRKLIIGNLIVAIYSAGVPLLVFLSEMKIIISSNKSIQILSLFAFYTTFALLSTLAREIIKDIEDIKGDEENNCKTIPIVFGKSNAFIIANFINLILIAVIIFYRHQFLESNNLAKALSIIFLVLPIIHLSIEIYRQKMSVKNMSTYYKFIMLLGLLFLIFI